MYKKISVLISAALLFACSCTDGKDSSTPAGPPTDGMVAYYPFSGTNDDESGNSRHATVGGGNPQRTSDANGIPDSALAFNGSADYLNTPISDSSGAFTVAAWILAGNDGLNHSIVSKHRNDWDDDGFCDFSLMVDTQFRFAFVMGRGISGISNTVTSPVKLAEGKWSHVAAKFYSWDTMEIYVNGSKVASGNLAGPRNTTTSFMRIGRYNNISGNNFFAGSIDEILIYGRALSDAEIKSIYDFGRPW